MRRVAITGVGAICALGRNAAEFAEALRQGRSGIAPIESTDRSQLRFQNGAEVRGYSHQPYFDDRRADFMDRFAQFAVIAAREAVADAGVAWTPELRENAAIVTGSCVGGQCTEDVGFRRSLQAGPQPRASADHPQDHGQRGRQPHLHGVRHHRPQLHHFHGLLLGRPRHRPGLLDGALGRYRPGHHGRQRSALQLRDSESLGGHARGFAGHLPPVFQGPPRHDPGRRRRHAGAGAARSRPRPRARASTPRSWASACPPTPATSPSLPPKARRGPCGRPCAMPASRPSRSATSTRTAPPRRPTIPPRRRPSAPFSARTRSAWRSARRSPCTATRWARRPPWSAWPPRWRCATACCRPPPTSASPIRSATWT